MPSQSNEQIAKAFEQALNKHGYGFQYKVLYEIRKLAESGKTQWWPYVSEFPVEVQGSNTRVDFILRYSNKPLLILAECKRVNPALANWCFAKADIENSSRSNDLFLESLTMHTGALYTEIKRITDSDRIFNIAVEGKTNEKGEKEGNSRGIIEEASTQLCRGMNGLIKYFKENNSLMEEKNTWYFWPVIFTTANLFFTRKDFGSVNINDGLLALDAKEIEKVNWLHYHYHQSKGIKHEIPSKAQSSDLRSDIYVKYIRNITVINQLGIEEYFIKRWNFV